MPHFTEQLFGVGNQGFARGMQSTNRALDRSQQASQFRRQLEQRRRELKEQEEARKKAEKKANRDRNLSMGLMAGTAVAGGALAAGALAPAVAAPVVAGEVASATAPALATGAAELGAIGAGGLGLAGTAAPPISAANTFAPSALAASQGATPLGLNAGQVASPIASASRLAPAAVVAPTGPSVGRGVIGGGGATGGFGGGGGGPGPVRTPARSITGRQGGQALARAPGSPQQGGLLPQTQQQFGISGPQQAIGTANQPFPGQGGRAPGPPPGTLPYPSTLKRSLVGAGLGLTDAFSGANNLGGYLGQLGGIPGRNAALAQQMWQRGRSDRQDAALADYRGGITADRDRTFGLAQRRENRLENPQARPLDALDQLRFDRETGAVPLGEVGAADLARKRGLEARAAEAADYEARTRPSVDDVRGDRALARETAGFTRDIRRSQAFDGIGPRLTGDAAQIAQSGRLSGMTDDEIAAIHREYATSIGQPGGRGTSRQTLSDFKKEVMDAGFSAEKANRVVAMKIRLEAGPAATRGPREAAVAEAKLAREMLAAADMGILPLSAEDKANFTAIASRAGKMLSGVSSQRKGGGDVTGSLRAIRTRIDEAIRFGNPQAARFILDEAAGTLSAEDRKRLEFMVSQAGG